MKTVTEIVKILSIHLQSDRIAHSERVAILAKSLAKKHGLDENLAFYAGLWHDIAKDESPESITQLGLSVSKNLAELYRTFPKLFHAFIGPSLARHYENSLSLEILQAMEWHTTGKAHMSALDQVVFIADYCEPERKDRDLDFFLNSASQDLDQATGHIIYNTVAHLHALKRKIHPFSLQCYNHYLSCV